MIGRESVTIALRGILASKLRSGLTMLGILIGVGAVIVLVAVGNGSSKAVQKRIEALGTNTLIVAPQRAGLGSGRAAAAGTQSTRPQLTAADVKALQDKSQAPDVKSVSPIVNVSVTATWQGSTYNPSQFSGTTTSLQEARSYEMASGTFFTPQDLDQHDRVAVVGETVVTSLFGGQSPLGQRCQFNGQSFTIVGVLKPKGTNGLQDQDDVVIAPLTAVQDNLSGAGGTYNVIVVEATSQKAENAAAAEVSAILDDTHRLANSANPDFRIINQASLLATSSSTGAVFTTLLGAVAAISLLVGGIGIMNIMLVTVTERTREIGIRKAIGAKKADILSQFVVEAVLLALVGGLIGVGVGLGGTRFTIVGVRPVVAPYSVFMAFGVSLLIGLFFGIYPANRAAKLRPIDALHYE